MPIARVVSEERLKTVIGHLLRAVDVPPDHAARAAYVLTTAELRGISSHGVRLVPANIRRILGGAIKARPDIKPVLQAGSLETWDGDFGMGMVCGSLAMDRAIELAANLGTGWVMVRRSNHCAAVGAYAMMAVERGFVGISMSNSSPMMALEGSVSRTIGNNPMAIGAPGPEFPVVLDMAMSVASGARIGMMRRNGKAIPDEWFVAGGDPAGRRIMRPFGGPKGSGLAVMVEVITGVLAGGGMLSDQSPGSGFSKSIPDNCCHALIAVNLKALMPEERYESAMRRLVRELKSGERAPGVEEVRLPGERAWRETLKRRREGIPLEEETVQSLEEIAAEIGTAVPWE